MAPDKKEELIPLEEKEIEGKFIVYLAWARNTPVGDIETGTSDVYCRVTFP